MTSTKSAAELALEFIKVRIPNSFRDEDEMLRMTALGKSSTYDAYLAGHAEGYKAALESDVVVGLVAALEHAISFCLCERFKTQRWLTPKDKMIPALAKYKAHKPTDEWWRLSGWQCFFYGHMWSIKIDANFPQYKPDEKGRIDCHCRICGRYGYE